MKPGHQMAPDKSAKTYLAGIFGDEDREIVRRVPGCQVGDHILRVCTVEMFGMVWNLKDNISCPFRS